ncbi:MAG TPA: hypothetical protein VIY29_21470, partial [Ktedonobacteraceae bacterium]
VIALTMTLPVVLSVALWMLASVTIVLAAGLWMGPARWRRLLLPRVSMPSKRFSRLAETFSIPQPLPLEAGGSFSTPTGHSTHNPDCWWDFTSRTGRDNDC